MKGRTMAERLFQAALYVSLTTLGCGLARASTNHFTFDEDPSALFSLIAVGGDNDATYGNLGNLLAGKWISSNGSSLEAGVVDPSTNGYFAITQTTSDSSYTSHGMNSTIVFNDFDSGLVVAGFTFSCDLRIGAGSSNPADGFSLNYARAGDPCITSGHTWSNDPYGGSGNEEGTTTGLALSFDAYQNTGTNDVIGLTIKVDGVVITNIAMPTKNGACDDITSLQTGPISGGLDGLCWQPLYVRLATNGLLTVKYKGADLVTDYSVKFTPSPGRLIFGGRTGGAWQEQDVDNITIITVPSATPVVGDVASTPYGWKFNIYDSGTATPNIQTITVTVDGVPVTPTGITQSGNVGSGDGTGTTIVAYESQTQLFVSGSTHTNIVHFEGTGFAPITKTIVFTVPPVQGALDRTHHYLARFQGKASYSANQGGRTGAAGDYAADIGTPARQANGVLATDANLMSALNAAAVNDTMTFAFWIKHRNTASTSALWAYSSSAPQNRGVNLHCPYYDNADSTVFFDTGGTAAAGRISAKMTTFPAYTGSNSWWTTWHHVVAVKNGTDKQVWIDGQLFMSGTGQAVLYPDISRLYIGSGIAALSVDGWIDDFAVYSSALTGTDVTSLYTGTAPDAISAGSDLIAWWDFNDAPDLTSTQKGDNLVLTFTQVLQSSTNVNGPYVDMPAATSPHTNVISAGPQMFFRTRK